MGFPANRGVHGVSGAPVVHATAELTIDWFPKIGVVVATFPAKPPPLTRAPEGSFRVIGRRSWGCFQNRRRDESA
jgi:hypothetical protein